MGRSAHSGCSTNQVHAACAECLRCIISITYTIDLINKVVCIARTQIVLNWAYCVRGHKYLQLKMQCDVTFFFLKTHDFISHFSNLNWRVFFVYNVRTISWRPEPGEKATCDVRVQNTQQVQLSEFSYRCSEERTCKCLVINLNKFG